MTKTDMEVGEESGYVYYELVRNKRFPLFLCFVNRAALYNLANKSN